MRRNAVLIDQAANLRGLMQDSLQQSKATRSHVVFVSGKGGVGVSQIALNTAHLIASRGTSTLLVDANRDWPQLPFMTGMPEALTAPRMIAPHLTIAEHEGHLGAQQSGERSLISEHSAVVVDAGSGSLRDRESLLESATDLVLISTPDVISIMESYRILKQIAPAVALKIHVLINRAESSSEAKRAGERLRQTASEHLGIETEFAGALPDDPQLRIAHRRQDALVLMTPLAPFSRALASLTGQLVPQESAAVA